MLNFTTDESPKKMKTLQIKISDNDYQKYNFNNNTEIKFTDLVEKISLQYAKTALLDCNQIAKEVGLSTMTLEEINAEINEVREENNSL